MFRRMLFSMVGAALCALPAAAPAWAQSDRVVALVVSVGDGGARADAIQAQLQVIGAETLRAADPNNAELRSILKRFTGEAAASRAAFVYLDAPAVTFEGREFVTPAGATLGRSTDLFTQGIPLLAFARAAAQAEQGGAVVAAVGRPPADLPAGVSALEGAPAPTPGSSPVLVAPYGRSDAVVQVISAVTRDEVIEVGAMLRRMQAGEGVSLSASPAAPIYLRAPAAEATEVAAIQVEAPEADASPETLEELELLEQSLSRAAKRAIQRELRDKGLYQGLVDGIFGPQTRGAITAFQQARTEDATGVLTRRQMLDLRAGG
ncbi:peptidoglycan-binding domain-containing protein [Albimonas pacifica]|uniref:Putative peptidoglycan binding domain-containing protein n=1 Tax=Albimonas pacifica TaxID=1114924 RepID=A0A1I3CYH1_9RHOB|nr:peptidoglycan-binding domain-containing protein [Albimonas pacifica]SFH79542.1 Putative peptidoglycan binding domain-containing protein [Albimonas pacifica]